MKTFNEELFKAMQDEWNESSTRTEQSIPNSVTDRGSFKHGFLEGGKWGYIAAIEILREKMEQDGYVPMWCDWLNEQIKEKNK